MPKLIVADQPTARDLMQGEDRLWVLSLLDPESQHWPDAGPNVKWHARVEVSDITDHVTNFPPPFMVPRREHAEQIIDFASRWDRRTDVLIHCAAGRSRSAAAALIFMILHGPTDAVEVGLSMRRAGPWFTPNRLLIWHADEVLYRRGHLLVALGAMRGPTTVGQDGPAIMHLSQAYTR